MDIGKNHYSLLSLPSDATLEEIKRAYRKAARRLHPDANPAPGAVETFLCIQQAYETLSNPSQRLAYDAALPVEQKALDEITVTLDYSQSALREGAEKQLLYVLMDIEAVLEGKEQPAAPLNICLIVDSSTSMKGLALDTVKEAALDLVRQLRPIDYLSIVSFNDRAEILLSAASSFDQINAEKAIRMLKVGGGTEIGKGLAAGYTEILKYSRFDTVSQILLMTDGRTYGDEQDCLRIAEGAALEGIVINGLGIGSRWNDVFLDALASKTGGSCIFLEDLQDIRHFLKDTFTALTRRYADRVILDLDLGQGAELNYMMRLQPESAPLELETPVILGSLPYSSPLSILIEIQLEGIVGVAPQYPIASGFLSYEIPTRSYPDFTTRISLQLPVHNSQPSAPSQKMLDAISRLTLYRMQERAKIDLEHGNPAGAAIRLERLATRLLSQGEKQLARTIFKEAENLQQNQAMSEEGKKRIKYGTRALLLPAPFGRDDDELLQKVWRESS